MILTHPLAVRISFASALHVATLLFASGLVLLVDGYLGYSAHGVLSVRLSNSSAKKNFVSNVVSLLVDHVLGEFVPANRFSILMPLTLMK